MTFLSDSSAKGGVYLLWTRYLVKDAGRVANRR